MKRKPAKFLAPILTSYLTLSFLKERVDAKRRGEVLS